jgi:LysR family transcriptional regulator (chromosome initiation inhibitor)
VLIREQPPRLTSLGAQLLEHARGVQRLEQELEFQLEQTSAERIKTVTIGVNGDSLATWFFDAISESVRHTPFVFEFIIENEEVTFSRLKRGEVLGCISSRAKGLAGCEISKIGSMYYRMVATPAFIDYYFPKGFSYESLKQAPAVIYDSYDFMHAQFLEKSLRMKNVHFPFHTIGNSHAFFHMVKNGLAYGMVPELQCTSSLDEGELVDLAPTKIWKQELYWHHQRGMDKGLKKFSEAIVRQGKKLICMKPSN